MSEKKNSFAKREIIAGILALVMLVVFGTAITIRSHKEPAPVNTAITQAEIITNEAPAVSINAKDVADVPTGNPFAGRYVTYQGITKIETADVTYLINPSDNDSDVYMEFVVSENGEVIYSSELIAAGKGIDVNFPELLSEGEHTLTVTMNPYLEVEGEYLKCPVNNAQDVTVNM